MPYKKAQTSAPYKYLWFPVTASNIQSAWPWIYGKDYRVQLSSLKLTSSFSIAASLDIGSIDTITSVYTLDQIHMSKSHSMPCPQVALQSHSSECFSPFAHRLLVASNLRASPQIFNPCMKPPNQICRSLYELNLQSLFSGPLWFDELIALIACGNRFFLERHSLGPYLSQLDVKDLLPSVLGALDFTHLESFLLP